MIDLDKLKKLAMAASPGPWKNNGATITGISHDFIIYDEGGHSTKDARFIAAANPAAILELIHRLNISEKFSERYKKIRISANKLKDKND